MDIQITNEKDMPLLSRKMIEAEAGFTEKRTPSNSQIRDAIAKLLKADPEKVVIRHIYQRYGTASARIFAYVYDDETAMKSFEKESKLKYESQKEESKEENKEEPAVKSEAGKEEREKEESNEGSKGGSESGKEKSKE